MPKCDICKKVVDIHGGIMTYKHLSGVTGFRCGDCEAEKDYDREAKRGAKRLSNLLEEESREVSHEVDN